MDLPQVLALLRKQCAKDGQAAWAKAHGLSPAYVSDVLNGRREPGAGILRGLRLERVVSYRRIRGEWATRLSGAEEVGNGK